VQWQKSMAVPKLVEDAVRLIPCTLGCKSICMQTSIKFCMETVQDASICSTLCTTVCKPPLQAPAVVAGTTTFRLALVVLVQHAARLYTIAALHHVAHRSHQSKLGPATKLKTTRHDSSSFPMPAGSAPDAS
jgi:hypothetical protein